MKPDAIFKKVLNFLKKHRHIYYSVKVSQTQIVRLCKFILIKSKTSKNIVKRLSHFKSKGKIIKGKRKSSKAERVPFLKAKKINLMNEK